MCEAIVVCSARRPGHPNRLQKQVAILLGETPEKLEVNVTLIGGGFGRRLAVDYSLEAAEISRSAKAPVQIDGLRTCATAGGSGRCLSALIPGTAPNESRGARGTTKR
jgi:xanthine dehydrogenase molybdopterin-binding subunit B